MYPTPADPSALFMMGAQGMGMRRPRRFVQRMFEQEEPLYEPQERGGMPQEFQGYIDPESIAGMLTGMRKDAISQGLVGAGAAIMGAPDLASGLSQGATAFSTPFFQYKDAARSLPIEMAGQRYQLAGEEEERQRERNAMGQSNRLFDFKVSEGEFDKDTQHLRKRAMRLQNALGKVGLQGDRTRLGFLADQLTDAAAMSKEELNRIREELNFYRQTFNDRAQAIASGNYATEASGYRDVIDAGASGGRGGSGGIMDDATLAQLRAVVSSAITDSDERIRAGALHGANRQIERGFQLQRIYDSLPNVPPELADVVFPSGRIVDQVMADVHSGQFTPEQLEQKYSWHPDANAYLSYVLWDKERDMGRGR